MALIKSTGLVAELITQLGCPPLIGKTSGPSEPTDPVCSTGFRVAERGFLGELPLAALVRDSHHCLPRECRCSPRGGDVPPDPLRCRLIAELPSQASRGIRLLME